MEQNIRDMLEGLGDLDTSHYDLDQIMAEFGKQTAYEQPAEDLTEPEPLPEPEPKPIAEPEPEHMSDTAPLPEPPAPVPLPETGQLPIPGMEPLPEAPKKRKKKKAEPIPEPDPDPEPESEDEAEDESDPLLSMEDIVAGTVGAVLEEQAEARQEETRQLKRKQRKNENSYRTKTKLRIASDEEDDDLQAAEPSMAEATIRMKRLRKRTFRLAIATSILSLLYWTLEMLPRYDLRIPYCSDIPMVPPLVCLGLQVVIMICAWPVFARAGQELKEGRLGWGVALSLGSLSTLLDTVTVIFSLLPQRCDGQSFGSVSVVALTLALWGLCFEAIAYRDTFRLAALGQPAYVVDTGPNGAVKGTGSSGSFYNRAVSEDTASAWHRLLIPVFLTAAVVFALLSSWGQGNSHNFLWCFSAILTSGTAFSLPLVYSLPFARLASRLGKSGGAVAGSYGAQQLSRCREIILGDSDLFPPGSVRMLGKKVIAEDRKKVASYAGSLAEELGACYAPLMRAFMQEEGAKTQPLVHFHIHDDGGASASIKGETVILGSAFTLRKQAVRLPRALEQKEGLYLAIDGQLSAIFALEYTSREGVEWALHAMKRNNITPLLALRDGALSPKFLKQKFGSDGGAILLDAAARSSLAQPGRSMEPRPNGLLYREGLAPFFEVVAGGKRLARVMRQSNFISLLGCTCGTLLAYYLVFSGSVSLLTPSLLMIFLLLWLIPVLLLGWSVDRI